MQTLQDHVFINQSSFPFERLAKIESTISAASNLIVTLEAERDLLVSQLDCMTRPEAKPDAVPNFIWARSFLYRGKLTSFSCFIDAYQAALICLFSDFPEKRLEMARVAHSLGRTRLYISPERNSLFSGAPQHFIDKHSRGIVEGWYFDTNLNVERMRRILPRLAAVVGFKWGVDIKVYWRRENASLTH